MEELTNIVWFFLEIWGNVMRENTGVRMSGENIRWDWRKAHTRELHNT
jgi:hypothetical protein